MNDIESANSGGQDESSRTLPETAEVCTGPDPVASVIWLHGLGADGHDFEPAVPHLIWPEAPAIRFVFPHAEIRPVTVNGGMPMRAWYDILSFDRERDQDETGIEKSVQQVNELINRELRRGIASERIVLAGFSQGGAIAIQAALRYPHRLAGLIAISTYFLLADRMEQKANPINRGLPVFMAHGSHDPVVPYEWGELAAQKCRELGCDVEWHRYPMEHSVCPQQLSDMSNWLSAHVGRANG